MAVFALAAIAVPAGLAGQRSRGPVREATRALRRDGYTHIKLSCSGSSKAGRCRWTARRLSDSCTGRLTVSRERRVHEDVRVTRSACTELVPPVWFGFNTFTTAETIASQRQLGATASRLFVDWAVVEPSPGDWNWVQPDAQYAALLAHGLRPLIVAFAAPCWARPSTPCDSADGFTGPPDPAYDQDWITYVHDLAVRYPQAAGIEIWNEPNLDRVFLPAANPVRYTQLLEEAYTAIKAVDPKLPVISGGLLLSPPVPGAGPVLGGYAADQFLATMYANGAAHYMDALGVHIYPSDYVDGSPARWDPNAMTAWLDELGAVRDAAGESEQPIWITEMGISTATQPGWPAAASLAQQASDLTTMFDRAKADPAVRAIIIHTLMDAEPDATNLLGAVFGGLTGDGVADNQVETGFGVLTASGATTPAACAVSKLFGGSLSC